MQNLIHPTAVIENKKNLGSGNEIGAYSIIGKNVILGNNNIIKSHVIITGNTSIGNNNQFYPFACIGESPQDKKYKGENSNLTIGSDNIFREYVTINPGTEGGGMITIIGNNCLLMASVHIAHDCKIADNIIFANNATLAGHVTVESNAQLGGLCAIRQFVRIGKYAMIGGMAGVDSDIIPYGVAVNERANLAGINIIGLKRSGVERAEIHNLIEAYDKLFKGENNFDSRVKAVAKEFSNNSYINEIIEFLSIDSSRAICKPKDKSE